MADLIRVADGLLWDRPGHRVYTRQRWDEEWTPRPRLFCDALTQTSGPQISQAQLSWVYGEVLSGGQFQPVEKLSIARHFVKVEIDQIGPNPSAPFPGDGGDHYTWHGIVEEIEDQRGGVKVIPDQPNDGDTEPTFVPRGRQLFGVLGLEHLLRGVALTKSQVRTTGGAMRVVERAITFNDPRIGPAGEVLPMPNRSSVRGPLNVYTFTDQPTAEFWTTRSIVEYLLAYFGPRHEVVGTLIPFALAADSTDAWPIAPPGPGLEYDRPVLHAEGRNTYELLSALLDRRRLLGWTIAGVDPINRTAGRETVLVLPYRFNRDELTLGQGTIPPNGRQKTLAGFDAAIGRVQPKIRESHTDTYHKVTMRGGRNRTVFSLAFPDLTLVEGWSGAEAARYNAGASGQAGYDDLDTHEQEKRDKAAREIDALRRVYRRFRLWSAFTGFVGDGQGADSNFYFPGNPPFYLPAWRFLARLPLKPPTGADADDEVPALVVIKDPENGKWQLGDRAATESEFAGHETGRRWSLRVIPAPDTPALDIDVTGFGQHAIAGTQFVPLEIDEPSELDWHDSLILTVAVEIDQWAAGSYVRSALAALDEDTTRELIIDLGPVARRDWLVKGTVTGVDSDGNLVREPAGRWLRDDAAVLTDLAQIAGQWYTRPRQACELGFTGIYGGLFVGDLLASIGERDQETELNAAVTAVHWDLVSMQTMVTTDFGELDVTQLGQFLGLRK